MDAALLNQEEWVETSPKIIQYYNRNGLGPHAEYFNYKGVKVCEFGKSEAIQQKLDRKHEQIVYGSEAGTEIKGDSASGLKNAGSRI